MRSAYWILDIFIKDLLFAFEYLVLSTFGKLLVLTLNAAEKIVLGEDFEINLDISVFVCTIAEHSWFEFSSSLVEVAMRQWYKIYSNSNIIW